MNLHAMLPRTGAPNHRTAHQTTAAEPELKAGDAVFLNSLIQDVSLARFSYGTRELKGVYGDRPLNLRTEATTEYGDKFKAYLEGEGKFPLVSLTGTFLDGVISLAYRLTPEGSEAEGTFTRDSGEKLPIRYGDRGGDQRLEFGEFLVQGRHQHGTTQDGVTVTLVDGTVTEAGSAPVAFRRIRAWATQTSPDETSVTLGKDRSTITATDRFERVRGEIGERSLSYGERQLSITAADD